MKVLLCGEGVHEVGRDVWSPKMGCWKTEKGWMQPIVSRIAKDAGLKQDVDYEIRHRNQLTLLPRAASGFKPLPPGHGTKALAAALVAKSLGADVAVFMVDADTNDATQQSLIQRQIADGFTAASDADLGSVGVACVPMSSSESWLLADSSAWTSACGASPELPKHPEMLWGARNDPFGNHPKHVFRRATENVNVSDSPETRHQIACESDITALTSGCPRSFSPFADDLKLVFAATL